MYLSKESHSIVESTIEDFENVVKLWPASSVRSPVHADLNV